ncbi:NUDIX hydrolase [Pseudomonas aeruginosa]
MEKFNAVVVAPYCDIVGTDEKHYLLVAMDDGTFSFPYERLDEGESPGDASYRILLEQTTYVGSLSIHLGELKEFDAKQRRLVGVSHMYFETAHQSPDAVVDGNKVRHVRHNELLDMAVDGSIKCCLTLAAIGILQAKGLLWRIPGEWPV